MSEHWHRTAALVGLPGMPRVARSIQLHGARRGWVKRTVAWGKRANVLEWLESSLPAETQAVLRQSRGKDTSGTSSAPKPASTGSAWGPSGLQSVEDRDLADAAPVLAVGLASTRSHPGLYGLIPDSPGADLMDARLHVVHTFNTWYEQRGGSVVPAMREFAAAWAVGDITAPASVIELIPKMAWNTLQRWRNLHRTGGYRALLARKGGRGLELERDPEIADLVAALILEYPDQITGRLIHRALCIRYPGREHPSIRSIQRYIARFKVKNAAILRAVRDGAGRSDG